MKKTLFVLLVCFGISGFVFAGPIGFGLKAGGNLSNIIYDTHGSTGYDPKFGLIGGGFVDFNVLGKLSIQPEAYFSMKGGILSDIYVTGDTPVILAKTSVSYNYNYLEIPILLKFNLPITPYLELFFFSGPSISFLTSASINYSYNNESFDLMRYMNSPDYGIILGGGMEISKFLIDLRYEFGLTSPIFSDSNRVFSLLVGYRLL